MTTNHNYLGVFLKEIYIVSNKKYLKKDGNVDWVKWAINSDKDGFDIRNLFSDGNYCKEIILPAGKRIIRYGINHGNYTTDPGTDYEMISLPYTKESMPYHEYIVQSDCKVLCRVLSGKTAKNFEQPGGGMQYMHFVKVSKLLSEGILKEDVSWLRKKWQE